MEGRPVQRNRASERGTRGGGYYADAAGERERETEGEIGAHVGEAQAPRRERWKGSLINGISKKSNVRGLNFSVVVVLVL